MDREEYELFEYRPDGSLSWRGLVRGLESARVTVWLLADEIGRECFAMDSTTREIVLARAPQHDGKRVFHVGYGENTLTERAHRLQLSGCDVTSVLGNQVAMFVLCMHPPYDLFIIEEAESDRLPLEMMHWVRANYPGIQIIAPQPPQLGDVDELRLKMPTESRVGSRTSMAADRGLAGATSRQSFYRGAGG